MRSKKFRRAGATTVSAAVAASGRCDPRFTEQETRKEIQLSKSLLNTGRLLLLLAIPVALLAVGAVGCQGSVNVPAPPTGKTVSFSADIQPIFNANCTTCHVTGGLANIAGIRLVLVAGQSFDLLVNQPSSQRPELTLVVPGNARASLLFLKVSRASPPVGSTMPLLAAPLSSTNLGLIRDWINQGALDN